MVFMYNSLKKVIWKLPQLATSGCLMKGGGECNKPSLLLHCKLVRVQPHVAGVVGVLACPLCLSWRVVTALFTLYLHSILLFKLQGDLFKFASPPHKFWVATSAGAAVRGGNFNSSPCTGMDVVSDPLMGGGSFVAVALMKWCRTRQVRFALGQC